VGNYRFILSGGGTGGHIYPAIAIANELKKRYPDASFLFVGAEGRMEMEKVPMAGYKIIGLQIAGFQRKLTTKNLSFPFKLLKSLNRAKKIVSEFNPDVVIGTGGFASGPVLRVASNKGIPCVLQEQNSYAGVTNKLLKNKVAKICVAYDGMNAFFPSEKIIKTGNPVRGNLTEINCTKNDSLGFYRLNLRMPTVLILGGSLGSRRINQLVESKLDFFAKYDIQVIWQCGKLYYEEYKKYQSDTVKVEDFMHRMDFAYTAADFIISRAGAGSVSELSIVGKPTVFIPSPNVAEDHQTKNAQALVEKNAAILIKEKDLDTDFEKVFEALFLSETDQQKLGENFNKMALPKATEHIVDEIEKLLNLE